METQIKLENVSAIQKKFIVTIPADRVTRTVEKKFIETQKVASLKGFRPGKVPLTMVKQYYADDVKQRALQTLISESYSEALKKHPLRIVGEPQIEGVPHGHDDEAGHQHHHIHIHDGESLSFTATVEIVPEVEPKDYKGLSLEKSSEEVTSEDLGQVKKSLLDRKAELTPVERAAKMGDHVDFKYEGKVKTDSGFESNPELSGNRAAELGSGQLMPEFEAGIVGVKPGANKTFKMTYPADYRDQNLAGKEAEYTVDVREVKEKKLPEWTEELAKEFGYEGIADFETKTRERLSKGKKEEVDNQLRNHMIEKLIEKNSFEVPQALVYSQIRALADDYANELKRYGFNDQMVQSAIVSQLEDFKKRAETQVRAGILLDAIAKKEKIEVKPSDMEAELTKMAKGYGVETSTLQERFDSNPREKSNFEFRVREEMTIQLILGAAKIKEKKAK
ncbi:MAG: trigger factor [Bdellovibrionales bacterium]|nr:trigger factor [Bdellovibrionales bacterium]